ncbi:MAG: glycosyltransferase, partial [Bacteroidia bacterium]|nr:glycosyltransferase [Bacteroidia bacterium]
ALRHSGVDACLLSTDDHGHTRLDVPLHEWTSYEGIPTYFLPRFRYPLKEFIYTPGAKKFLKSHIRQYDLVHTHYLFSYLTWTAASSAQKSGIPYIMTPYGMLAPQAISHRYLKKLLFFQNERSLLRRAAGIHCSTEEETRNVNGFGVSGNSFINPYIILETARIPDAEKRLREKYPVPEEASILLFLARLHPIKQPELILRCVARLKKEGYPMHLLVTGDRHSPYAAELAALTERLNISREVTFTGFIQGEEKNLLYQGADLYVLPSRTENFGMTVCEALEGGTPVLITREVQIAGDLERAGGALVSDNNEEDFYNKLLLLLNDTELRTRLAENGRAWVRTRYNPQQVAQELKATYARLIRPPGTRT